MELSSEMVKRYVSLGGEFCPYCQSPEVEQTDILRYDDETAYISKDMICCTCGKEWTDLFTLSAVKVEDKK